MLTTSIACRDGKVILAGQGKKSYAKVLKADIEFEGNVVHVISSVLLPDGFDAYEVCVFDIPVSVLCLRRPSMVLWLLLRSIKCASCM